MSAIRHALNTRREDDFAAWYQEVISAADMAEESGVRGCMVIKPWGYGIWERMQRLLDDRIKAAGVQNAGSSFEHCHVLLCDFRECTRANAGLESLSQFRLIRAEIIHCRLKV